MSNATVVAMAVVGLCGALLTAIVWVTFRIRVLRPLRATARAFDYRMLPVLDLAFIAGGSRRALLTAMSVAQSDPEGKNPDPLVVRARSLGRLSLDAAEAVNTCREELGSIRSRLESAGLLVPSESASRTRTIVTWIGGVVFLAELVLGILAWRGGAPLRDAAMAVFLLFFFSFWLPGLIFAPGRRARAVGRPLVARARKDFASLAPKRVDDYAHLGPWAMPLATALFGGSAMMRHAGIALSPLWGALSRQTRSGSEAMDYGTLGDVDSSSDSGDPGGGWD